MRRTGVGQRLQRYGSTLRKFHFQFYFYHYSSYYFTGSIKNKKKNLFFDFVYFSLFKGFIDVGDKFEMLVTDLIH